VDVDFVLRTRLADPFIRGLPHMGFYLELFRARDDRLVWAERLSFSPDLTAERYEDIIGLVVQRIAGKAERHRSIGANPRAYPAAYLTYLEGQQHLQSLHLPLVRRARQLFRAAQDVAPQHAEAASALARTFIVEWVLRNGNDDELLERAEKAAQRALSLDPESALGERELGLAALYRRQYDESLRHFEAAEAGSPHHADMIADHADALVHCSMLDEAAERIERALDLNPAAPDSYLWTAAGASFLLGRFGNAITYLSRMQNVEPALRLFAACAAKAGEAELARRLRDRELEIHPDFRIKDWIETVPLRNPQHVRQYAEGLKAAGFQ
jgi:tetratricopeptide (TPR) repeat protein